MNIVNHFAVNIVKTFCENIDVCDDLFLSTFNKKVEAVCSYVFAHYPHYSHLTAQIQAISERMLIDNLIQKSYDLFVVNFPKTKANIVAFQRLMQNHEWYGRENLTNYLTKEVHQKLLHVGINTNDILKGYASIVESLALFDPSFVLVHRVCRTIRDYVKARPDTMRTIIKFITTEKPGETANANKLTLILNEEQLMNVNDEYVIAIDDNLENRWFDWRPDPFDADPRESRLYRESADVFNMLVSVYGSKDLFVKEYQKLLAERLQINAWEKHLYSEFLYLETMKKRFTDGELNHCEVMMRDIKDCGTLAKQTASKMPYPVTAKIISSAFWPEFTVNKNIPIHPIFHKALKEYETVFKQQKPMREIIWFPGCNSFVEFELKIDSVTISIEIPLPYANVLLLFLEKDKWNLEELKQESKLSELEVKRSIEWIYTRGIIIKCGLDESLSESFALTESTTEMQKYAKQQNDHKASDAVLAAMLSDEDSEEEEEEIPVETQVEELEQYWSYTKNFIFFQSTAEQPVTLARLAVLYKNFASPGKPGPSMEAISLFMQQKIRQNLIIFENGAYKPTSELKKSGV